MASMTLLDMVQDIMSDMDADEVNSINDTMESAQVAQIIKTTYYNIVDGRDYAFLYELFQLDPSGTTARPTHMVLPEDIIDLKWVKYNNNESGETKNKFEKVEYKTPEEFVEIVDSRDNTATNTTAVTDTTGIIIHVYNERGPKYFTSFDDENLVFDAYDGDKETTLTNANSQCYGKRSVAFTLSDSFTPDLPTQMFTYLLNEAKSTCFLTLKQMANPKAEAQSMSQKRRMSQDSWRIEKGIKYPNYGRK